MLVDGEILVTETYSYDPADNLLLRERRDEEGELSSELRYSYDSSHRMLSHESLGVFNKDWRLDFRYDDSGNLIEADYDDDIDGIIDARYTYTHDADGNAVAMSVDALLDGTEDGYWTATCVGPWDDDYIESF
jgi:hypothetical protein